MPGRSPSRPNRIRASAGLVVAALVAAALSGCAVQAGSTGCAAQTTSGDAVDSVTAQGRFGSAPTVRFPTPLAVSTTQSTALIRGTGAPISAAQQIVVDLTVLNASTGAVLTRTEYSGDSSANAFVVKNVAVPGLRRALVCAQVGERLAAVIPPSQGLPASSRPASLGKDDDIVAVVDVRKAYLARADGAPQVMAAGLPSVVLGPDGRPGVTLPEGSPPSSLTVADLRRGSGAVLHRGDTAVVQYTGVLWKTGSTSSGTVFDSSWTNGAPVSLPLKRSSIIAGLVKALAGQRVGSQVLAVVPPKDGYGNRSSSAVPAGSTLVFVVDVLGKA